MFGISRETVERLREEYPAGCRVRLIKMDDPQAPPPGTEGTVRGVDDIGSIMVAWDNGSGLHVAYGEDECIRTDRKPVLEYDSRGESGNIYWMLGRLLKIMRHYNKGTPWEITKGRHETICRRGFAAKSYEEALTIIGEEVELKDTAQ